MTNMFNNGYKCKGFLEYTLSLCFFFSISNLKITKMGNKKSTELANVGKDEQKINNRRFDFLSKQNTIVPLILDKNGREMKSFEKKRKILQELDVFILDNSIRETTVGQIRGHTLENKWEIYNEVRFIRIYIYA